jgi:redox-sensitive bicupin YhaK (pirin superfamily)
MFQIRQARERGYGDHGWLESYHTFSFADYHDPDFMGFGPLRVINEDRVQPGEGFGTHNHRDMEIVTYVLEGALAHKDSLGNGSVIRPGDVQRLSAGTGITHSEFNHSSEAPVHFLQIWIQPERRGLPPSYEERPFPEAEKSDRLCLIASRDGREGSVVIHQDLDLYATRLNEGSEVEHRTRPERKLWIQVARGSLAVDDQRLEAGDGLAVVQEEGVVLRGIASAEALLFDMG